MAASAEHLVKRFGEFAAVNDVSFKVADGAIFGFLGANGAGKTTTIRMMCGLLTPTSGKLVVAGVDIAKDAESVRTRIGYMSQLFSLYPDLTVEENLRFFGSVYGLRGTRLSDRIASVLGDLEMTGMKDRMAASLPLGYKQRLGLGSAALHRPEVIFLDEPTSGVDPVSRIAFWDFIKKLARKDGITVIVSTHFLNEAEYCDHILLMNAGRVVAEGSPGELRSGVDFKIFELEAAYRLADIPLIKGIGKVEDAYSWGKALRITARPDLDASGLVAGLKSAGIAVSSCREVRPSLEDVFIRHYEK
jgi:ABC-2 type transport system ATP-binding protein